MDVPAVRPFSLRTEEKDGATVVHLEGELDLAAVPKLQEALQFGPTRGRLPDRRRPPRAYVPRLDRSWGLDRCQTSPAVMDTLPSHSYGATRR